MSKSDEKENMIASLKERTVPRLRELGFHGTFPHFRRTTERANHILTFQFDKNGGGFVVEIAKTPPGDLVLPDGEVIPVDKITPGYLSMDRRKRLGIPPGKNDRWFRYDKGLFRRRISFEELAEEVLSLIDSEAEPWWQAA